MYLSLLITVDLLDQARRPAPPLRMPADRVTAISECEVYYPCFGDSRTCNEQVEVTHTVVALN